MTEPDASLLADFRSPPAGFGEVAFYWWNGARLDRERIRWQLDQLADAKISGLQVNYAHGTTGGIAWGLTYPSDPPLFSDAWWDLFAWFKSEANARGMAVSLSDYTLGIGQGWFCDEIIRDPALRGSVLEAVVLPPDSDQSATWTSDTLAAYAVKGGGAEPAGLRRVQPFSGGVAALPEETVVLVRAVVRPRSLDPMNPEVGRRYIAGFFQKFEDRFPGECGRGLNYFFSDELDHGVAGHLWTERLPAEFLRRKGYDLLAELPALFVDIGPRTAKVRLDYRDVMVALQEEAFFKPIYDWHAARGMTYGCDHGWRGRKTTEFGDYFRTQRWNQGPGCDQPRLASDAIKNKVASSIAHLHARPRTWLEGFYSSGWGTTSAQIADAVFRNFAHGHNLLTLHGLYYSTHGGWWEWAPPCNHFRMPYWPHFKRFLACAERLSWLLTRGVHACDVAILYPVAAAEAGPGGAESSRAAFAVAEQLCARGVDLDFIDFESLARSEARDGRLHVAGESYRVLVLPPMPAIRFSSLEAAARFAASGGAVVCLGQLPAASDHAGSHDPRLAELRASLANSPAAHLGETVETALARLTAAADRDFRVLSGDGSPFIQHRRLGTRHLFFIHGLADGARIELRATGRVSRLDAWNGSTSSFPIESATATHTRLRLPAGHSSPHLFLFEPGEPAHAPALEVESAPRCIALTGPWTSEPVPCLDNRWGDFRLPAFDGCIGPEIRRVQIAPADSANPAWITYPCGAGPLYECFEATEAGSLRARLLADDDLVCTPLVASWRWGLPDDPGFQGWHGLKGRVHDDLFAWDDAPRARFLRATLHVATDTTARWQLGGSTLPVAAWLNRRPTDLASPVTLPAGEHELLLEYTSGGRGHALLATSDIAPVSTEPAWFGPLQTRWFNDPRVVPMSAPRSSGALLLRFTIPPGTQAFDFALLGELVAAHIDGAPLSVSPLPRDAARFPSADALVWRARPPASAGPAEIILHVLPRPGLSGAQTLPDPVALEVGPCVAPLGDWAEQPGFDCYSGGIRYITTVHTTGLTGRAVLDLGDLSSTAEVWINGASAGVLCAPPWRLEVGPLLRPGDNQIIIEVRSALANHYKTIPTSYRGEERCGLFGPVRLEIP